MFSIIGALVGLIPHLFKFFQTWSDNKTELALVAMQMELAKLQINTQLQEIQTAAKTAEVSSMYNNIKVSIRWVDALNALIRPLLAILFVSKFVGSCFVDELPMNDHDYAILSMILSFYFGELTTRL